MPHDVAGLACLFHCFSFRFVLGIPAEALPPSAAILRRSSGLNFRLLASPAFRAISERSAEVSFRALAGPPSLPSAEACGLGIFFFMEKL
jgi:hypothetical protein